MADGATTYSFLPWLRSGLAALTPLAPLPPPPPAIATPPGRVRLNVVLRVTKGAQRASASEVQVGMNVHLYGPGDVVGIDRREVIRTDPQNQAADFESNFFPLIEFDTPEFPWLFSPGYKPVEPHRLTPWICLVVIRKGPSMKFSPTTSGPLPVLELPDARELPKLAEAWAWAHAQVVRAGDAVTTVLAQHPARTLSRLMCPRRLEPNASYVAFVVPTFEAGRQAGLGEAVTATTQPAWPVSDPTGPLRLPVYYHWEFTTGPGDDFESLARRLKPGSLPAAFGTLPVDASVPGGGLPAASPAMVPFPGVLGPAGATQAGWPDSSGAAVTFQAALRTRLVAPAGTSEVVVSPPIYGGGHAGSPTTLPASGSPPSWRAQLNLDPRYRAAAALGTEVVQAHQEELVAAAWAQLGEIERANQLLRNAQLARAIGEANYARRVRPLPHESLLHLTGPAHSRLRLSTGTVRKLVHETALPDSAASTAFRKVFRPAGPITRRVAGSTSARDAQVREFVNALSKGAIPLPLVPQAAGAVSVERVSAQVGTPAISYGAAVPTAVSAATGWYWVEEVRRWVGTRPAPAMSTASTAAIDPQPNGMGEEDPVRQARLGRMRNRFKAAAAAHQAHLRVGVPPPPSPPPPAVFPLSTMATDLTGTAGRLDPARTIVAQALDRLSLSLSPSAPDQLAPVLAAPTFLTPMFEPLLQVAPERLLPGIHHAPAETIARLTLNARFIEAYMVGLNHEFSRELLWRGVPADLRATFFRRFWTRPPNASAPGTSPAPTVLPGEVPPLHTWSRELGQHMVGSQILVLLLRGELLRRFPTAAVYVVKAASRSALGTEERLPEFRLGVSPDVLCVGFSLPEAEFIGSASDPAVPGWFLVIQPQPTEPRFGLDVVPIVNGAPQYGGKPARWQDLSWGHMAASATAFNALTHAPTALPSGEALSIPPVTYGYNSAHVARATLRQPTRIAIHGANFVPPTSTGSAS